MEIVVSIGAKISEYTVAPLGRQLGYLFYYTRNVENLNTQLQHLNDAQNRLQRRVQDAQNNCQVIEADVTTWLTTFGQISQEASTFLNHPDHAKVVCSCGSPPHLLMRHRLSRKATKMSIQVHELKEECKFDTIAYPPHLHSLSTTTTATATTSATKGYESFNSRRVILENIMAAVRDGNRKRIGLHGMGGIGKTMLAKEIHRLTEAEELFSKVVITTISQAPNIKEIQQHIAEMLDMTNFSQNESIGKRAELLRTRLEQDESKILLILDDIWKELNLEEIGIHDGCKILVTSRYLHVLRNSMGMAESDVFFIGALKSSEAINLFMKIIGDTKVENNAYYNDLALKIVDECGGLPIAIATVAHALKCNMDSLFIWEDALQRLRSSNFTGIEGMHDKVYKSIRLSYDFLGSHEEEAKLLLLLCALHKEDQQIQVEDLIRYFVGWQSLQGIYRVEDARNRVNSLVVKLKSHCLLLDGWSKSTVKMHDVIRDVCITIGKEDHGHRMMSNIVMYEDERPKASKAISFLHYDDFDNLPAELECPSLELLLLCSSSALKSIPEEFFKQTGLLKVLIMNRTWIGSLPSSFASLQNLQTLCLRGSNYLKDMTVIGELKNLKALDLSKSDSIKLLPKEIGALQRLQVLDLRGCRNLRVIEANVISNLTQMEELYLPREFEGWDKIIDEEGGIRNASLIEIKSLQRLTALHLYVPREHVLPEGLFSEKLERYQICIGVEKLMRRSECLSLVGLSLSQLEQVYARELISLMRRSECLSLVGSMSVNNVSPSLVNEGFPRLKHMGFHDNDGVQCIINSTDVAFPCLESLTLFHIRSLESIICDGGNNKLPRGSFNQLRKVDVWRCGRLKNLFPLSVAKLLHEIIVQECEMIEEIIVREDGEEVGHIIDGDDQSSLQLRCLHLGSLPKLVQFYCSNHRPARESYHPKPLFSETVSLPNLEDLTMKGVNIEKLWPEQLMVSSTSYMQNLTSLKVGSCHNLKYLFSSSVAQKFVNLKSIQVKDCNAMKDIIRVVDQPGEKESTHHDQIDRIDLLSKLEFVELVGLSSLQRFCSATDSSPCMVFPLLSKLHIKYCSTMKEQATAVSTQGPFFNKKRLPWLKARNATVESEAQATVARGVVRGIERLGKWVSFPKLEQLILDRMNTGKLWPDQLMVSSSSSSYMQNLTSLEVEECNNLKYLFSFSLAQKFVNLKKIKVKNCEAMEDIIKVVDQPGEEALHMERIDLFPKLQSLELDGLSSLQRFCCVTDSSSCMVFPLLSKLTIEDCPQMKAFVSCPTQPFYSEKVCFPKLKDLTMKKMEIEMLWPEQLIMLSSTSSFYMQNLTTLEVRSCHNLKYVFSFSLAQKFVNLKSIKVEDCEAMEDIIRVVDQPGEEETTHHHHDQMERIDLLPKLGSVELVGLSSLQTFCTATNSSLCMLLADQLMVSSSSSFYMQNLTTLEVEGCDSLKYVFSFSLAQKFVNLQSIRVGYCEAMEDIIRVVDQPGEEETTHHNQMKRIDLVPKLGSVKLCGLSALQRFCSSSADSCIMVFPLLSKLDIINCSTMKAQATLSTQEPFFNKKSIRVKDCEAMEDIIRVVDQPGEEETTHHNQMKRIDLFPKLEFLHLHGLSSLQKFSSAEKIAFPNLKKLDVQNCNKMKSLLSSAMARNLVQLERLSIYGCEKMEEVIVSDEEFL
ncbi:hypothetical protein F8388_003538 [Cannabis sativa]|uniref:AAA+ ATPase domain-containing protein n=1 Tax=Cannabis sativa TaxID=3483 RepID=A0A7J6EMG0_CANSA|nr:hypothetical protein F8388_003538 [Cannabis sativa]